MRVPGNKIFFWLTFSGFIVLVLGILFGFAFFPLIINDQIYRVSIYIFLLRNVKALVFFYNFVFSKFIRCIRIKRNQKNIFLKVVSSLVKNLVRNTINIMKCMPCRKHEIIVRLPWQTRNAL